ncbi:MAG: hypothetical protein ABGW77_06570 [Campylobacterales bacterium]
MKLTGSFCQWFPPALPILLFYVGGIFTGCGKPEPPRWYISPPAGVTEGVGAGPTREIAIELGVLEALQRLNSKVEGWVGNSLTYSLKGESLERFYQVAVKSLASAPFISYRILKLKRVGENWYGLIRLNLPKSREMGERMVGGKLEELEGFVKGGKWFLLRNWKKIQRLKGEVDRELEFLESIGGGEGLRSRFGEVKRKLEKGIPVEVELPSIVTSGVVAEVERRGGILIRGKGGVKISGKVEERERRVNGLLELEWRGKVVIREGGEEIEIPVQLRVVGIPNRKALREVLLKKFLKLLFEGG